MGIGTCIVTPTDLRIMEQGEDWTIVVSNANAFRDFTSASVLSIDWSTISLSDSTNLVSDLGAESFPMDDFTGSLGYVQEREVLAVPTRLSEEARTRAAFDDLQLLDISDPRHPVEAPLAEDGASFIEVESDPNPVAYDTSAGYLYVGNRTSHTISVVDMLADPITLVDARGDMDIGYERWMDTDASGSRAETPRRFQARRSTASCSISRRHCPHCSRWASKERRSASSNSSCWRSTSRRAAASISVVWSSVSWASETDP